MGITIHFEGRLKNEFAFEEVVSLASRFSEQRGWPCVGIDKEQVQLNRVRDEKDWDYQGPVKGLEIQPHENSEPFRLEFDKNFYIQEYTKTQFAPTEVHVQLIELLRQLQPYFEHLEIVDEGEYFETADVETLEKHMHRCFELLDEYLVQADKYYGPVRLESKRIVDVLSRD